MDTWLMAHMMMGSALWANPIPITISANRTRAHTHTPISPTAKPRHAPARGEVQQLVVIEVVHVLRVDVEVPHGSIMATW